jgi:hypothetical protein
VTTATGKQARVLVSRAVIWTGVALGTALAVLAIRDGDLLRIGGVPSWLGVFLGAVIMWALIVGGSIVLAELIRRYHKTARRYAIRHSKRGAAATARHGKRGAVAAARGTRAGARSAAAWLAARAASRWDRREHGPLMFRKLRSEPEDPAGEPVPEAEPPAPGAAPRGARAPDVPPADHEDDDGGITSMSGTASRIKTRHRAHRAAARSGGAVPSEWGPVIAETADFEPDDDGELLEWMNRQVTGLSAWAEALVDFYDHATNTIGIDPQASAMLHDVADAAAQAAETMGAAKARFTEHYELPREFAGNGGLMTHDGRWITGEGA